MKDNREPKRKYVYASDMALQFSSKHNGREYRRKQGRGNPKWSLDYLDQIREKVDVVSYQKLKVRVNLIEIVSDYFFDKSS